jgi:hypothetical protein
VVLTPEGKGEIEMGVPGWVRIASGKTPPGNTAWQQYPGGIFVDGDTSSGQFSSPPVYVTSLGGETNHWFTTGASSIYGTPPADLPTARGFRVYVRMADGGPISPTQANAWKWHINWIGIE